MGEFLRVSHVVIQFFLALSYLLCMAVGVLCLTKDYYFESAFFFMVSLMTVLLSMGLSAKMKGLK